jgi:biotin carboxylase
VDKRYYSPSPAKDWRAGKIQRANTEREEAYVCAIERICEQEQIDTIFPSFDPHVYVFSKNKDRFEKHGVIIPIPDYEIVITPLDKYRTIRAAEEVGFPCPKSYLPENEDDLPSIAAQLGFPLVVKARCSAGGRGIAMASNLPELLTNINLLRHTQSMPLVQEYIPGNQRQSFHIVLDKRGELKSSCCTKVCRYPFRFGQNIPTVAESIFTKRCHVQDAERVVQKLRWWGGVTVQTKIDPRDGLPKLLEINPRLGYGLWERTMLGINVPLMCLKIGRGEELGPTEDLPDKTMLLSPVEDVLGLGFKLVDLLVYRFRAVFQELSLSNTYNTPMTFNEIIHAYKETYINEKKKICNPYFTFFFQDPLVSFLWWFQFLNLTLRASAQLGR